MGFINSFNLGAVPGASSPTGPIVFHVTALSDWSAAPPSPTLVTLRPYLDLLADGDLATGGVGRPRRMVWPDPLRCLGAQLQVAQDALDPDVDFVAWVMPA